METAVFILVLLLLTGICFVAGVLQQKERKKNCIQMFQKTYGTFSTETISPTRYEAVSKYYKKHRGETFGKKAWEIDDITWNDLEMNRLFQMMNTTCSSPGEEYLYFTLRMLKDTEELRELEKLITYFQGEEDVRIRLQSILYELGKTGNHSLYEYLDYLKSAEKAKSGRYFLGNAAYLIGLLLLYLKAPLGILTLFVLLFFNITMYFREKRKIEPYLAGFQQVVRLLKAAGEMVEFTSRELRESAERLTAIKKSFGNFSFLVKAAASGGKGPFHVILDYGNMLFHFDLIAFHKMLNRLWNKYSEIDEMTGIFGKIETAIVIGSFREAAPCFCIPEFREETGIKAVGVIHPYLKQPVENSIEVTKGCLITGSNASGKSTFLKTMALNAIMAQTIHTALAETFQTEVFQIYSAMSFQDDLAHKESYYMVEIRALKRILDKACEKPGVLCFLDEVLRGTNTIERIAASTELLKEFAKKGCICLAATHDIELTELLSLEYENYHFEEAIAGKDVVFSYHLLPGRANTRNAILMLAALGYGEELVKKAKDRADSFLRTGRWS